jgi:purine-cytosine permease-like protein
MDKRIKYIAALSAAIAFVTLAYYFPAETFLTFTVGWLFFIPMAFVAYLIYGLSEYMSERKHRIEVSVKPTDAMNAIFHREMDIKREKEKLLYEESGRSI